MDLRVAIIGLGNIGHRHGISAQGDPLCHSEAYARHPDVTLALGVDPDPIARQAFQHRFPTAKVAAGRDDAPCHESFDIVSICSPTAVRDDALQLALRWSPKVVWCEKPLALTVSKAERMISACAAAGSILLINYSRRWSPFYRTLWRFIREEGHLGTVYGASIRYNGGLRHNGTHWIDLLCGLLGPPEHAHRISPTLNDSDDPPESIAMTWPSGFRSTLLAVEGTNCAIGEGEIWGSNGMVRFSEFGRRLTYQAPRSSQWRGIGELGPADLLLDQGLDGYVLEAAAEAVRLARQGGTPSCSGTEGLLALQIVETIRKGDPV